MKAKWNWDLHSLAGAERIPAFREELTKLARNGTKSGAALGVAAVVLFLAISVLTGKALTLTHGAPGLVVWDKLFYVLAGAIVFVVAGRLTLRSARVLVAVLVLAASGATLIDDVSGGDISFAPGYLIIIYLLAVGTVPYRPKQTAALGLGITLVLYAAVVGLPALISVPEVRPIRSHYAYMSLVTMLLSGISWLLYKNHVAQFFSRREAERLRDQLKKSEEAKDRFFANLSHEFRTPLTLLRGPLEDVAEGRYGETDARLLNRLQDMRMQVHRLRQLVDQLLDLSKLEAGRMRLRVREYDLAVLARRSVELFRAHAEMNGIDLQLEICEEPLPVWFDLEKMEMVTGNLLSNAFKFTQPGGAIRIRISQDHADDGDAAVLSVRDNGRGIAPDVLPVVFNRFESVPGNGSGYASTGIGLAFVKEVVERHGGAVTASSEQGFGAEFTVRLRLGNEHFSRDDLMQSTDASIGWSPSMGVGEMDTAFDRTAAVVDDQTPHILLVEDDAAVLAYIVELLSVSYRIDTAADGADALRFAQEKQPDLVVADVALPGLDGVSLCKAIKEDPLLAAIPIILLTAHAEENDKLAGLKARADAFLTKPFSSTELLVTVENLIEVRKLLQNRVRVPEWMAAKTPNIPSHDAEFLGRVQRVIDARMGDSQFGVEWLSNDVGLSSRQLQRRIQSLTRLTAAGFIKSMRMEAAARLLRDTDLHVGEVARAVGYDDANYFSRIFRQAHGTSPSEYVKDATKTAENCDDSLFPSSLS